MKDLLLQRLQEIIDDSEGLGTYDYDKIAEEVIELVKEEDE